MCRGLKCFVAAALSCLLIMMSAVSGESILVQEEAADAVNPLDIGSRLELFVDDFLIDTMTGSAERRMHHPVPREIVHTLEKPWEGDTSAYIAVVQDGGLIRLYYNASPRFRSQTPAVIESHDGITFRRRDTELWGRSVSLMKIRRLPGTRFPGRRRWRANRGSIFSRVSAKARKSCPMRGAGPQTASRYPLLTPECTRAKSTSG